MGILSRTISEDGSVVASALDGRDIVETLRRIHGSTPVITAALGRLSMGASLMGIGLKGADESITLRVKGGGPAGLLLAVADSGGNVRCCGGNYGVELPLNSVGKLDVGGAVGREGTLSVIKDLKLKEPYVGQIPLVSGEIGEDIASYFALSEQVPTVCGLGVLVDRDYSVKVAGGFLIQLLPFADPNCIDILEKNISGLASVTAMLESGMDSEAIAHRCLEGLSPQFLDSFTVEYRCDCTKERVERALISIGTKELREMAEEQEVTEVSCQFCDKVYKYSSKELGELAKGI